MHESEGRADTSREAGSQKGGLTTRILEWLLVRLALWSDQDPHSVMAASGIQGADVRETSRRFLTRRVIRLLWRLDPERTTRLFWRAGTPFAVRTEMARHILDEFIFAKGRGTTLPRDVAGTHKSASTRNDAAARKSREQQRQWLNFFCPLPRERRDLRLSWEEGEDATVRLTAGDAENLLELLERVVRTQASAENCLLGEAQVWWSVTLLAHDQGGAVNEEVLLRANAWVESLDQVAMPRMIPVLLLALSIQQSLS